MLEAGERAPPAGETENAELRDELREQAEKLHDMTEKLEEAELDLTILHRRVDVLTAQSSDYRQKWVDGHKQLLRTQAAREQDRLKAKHTSDTLLTMLREKDDELRKQTEENARLERRLVGADQKDAAENAASDAPLPGPSDPVAGIEAASYDVSEPEVPAPATDDAGPNALDTPEHAAQNKRGPVEGDGDSKPAAADCLPTVDCKSGSRHRPKRLTKRGVDDESDTDDGDTDAKPSRRGQNKKKEARARAQSRNHAAQP